MPSEEHQIISQLRRFHLGKWVSEGTAVWGCNSPNCFKALRNLINLHIIERQTINGFTYVRYTEYPRDLEVIK